MSITSRTSVALAVGAILLLPACESSPTTAPVRPPNPDGEQTAGIALVNGRYQLIGTTLIDARRDRVRQMSPQLARQIQQVHAAIHEVIPLLARLAQDKRIRALSSRPQPVHTSSGRPFTGPNTTHQVGTGALGVVAHGGLMTAMASYTCDDVALAIYEQTALLYNAIEQYELELEGLIAFDIPTYEDVARFGMVASDVIMWRTSLNILAKLYTANNCW